MDLYVFDLDKTLITADSYDLWHEYLHELGILGADFIKENDKMIELYDRGELDMLEYLEFSVQSLSKLSVNEIENLMPKFLKTKIEPIVRPQTKKWLAQGPNLVLSATPIYVVAPVAKLLGAQSAIGVNLEVANDHYTSKFIPPLSYQAGKIDALKKWMSEREISAKVHFYTDSINDLPMCEFADFVTCVEPDAKLREIALQKDWEIV